MFRSPIIAPQPHRHARLQALGRGKGIEPQAKAVEVMVADGARGPPGGELAERPELGHARGDAAAVVRRRASTSLPTVNAQVRPRAA